jgi:tRNA threonylcarbamoyladenosine biosynthesis protein TsaE
MSVSAEWRFYAADEAATNALGLAIALAAEPGTVIALAGSLGAGKTRLSRAIALGLEVDPRAIASPTFVLLHEYAGRLPVYHFDVYRLKDPAEFEELGAAEYLQAGGLCLVEWADRVADQLPEDRLEVMIEIAGEAARGFHIRAGGARSQRLLTAIAAKLGRE